MKDSKEKEHRISDLRDMIDTIKEDPNSPSYADIEEDSELIDYLNEDKVNFNEMEINDEFIYNPNDDEKRSPVNLDDTNINEKYIIKTPKEEDAENRSKNEEPEDIIGDVSENFDSILNAKIGRTPILAILSTILGLLLVLISAFIFQSRSDRVIDNVVSGETNFISVIVLAIGVLLLIYGFYKIFGIKNPIGGITDSINSIDRSNEKKNVKDMKDDATEMVIPKSNIPLDKDSYKIGEFNLKELKNKLKKQPDSKKPTPITEDIDKIPPAKEKEESKKGLTPEEIEDIEYEQTKLDSETIDEIFAEVEDIDEMPIISIDSEDKKE
ncbi:topoisomerase IV [Methanobrevibacter sp.]|uniref:topoisomerase IV n=1 Tax=Methanobrevibacter sp. TaxID=66852 RepID=UPI00388E40B0